ncbi:MAG: hypothetical protein N2323_03910 [candidate division WOR-3 bacterium]|nr:hypothetical protein [candidate division WOR-3 bacterium]MCX7837086.1 hypothetical protein [candidate division WOR-3 bacterium]MDW8114251.1 hypothetical protein [candidate division WOR-3 bacterium]
MLLLFISFLFAQLDLTPNITGNDYFGKIKVRRFLLKDTVFIFDLDGDKVKDTLSIHFLQTGYNFKVKSHKSEKIFLWLEEEEDVDIYIEVARAFLVNDEKPLLLIGIEYSPVHGNEFHIYDIVHTAKGIEVFPLLIDSSAGWASSPVILKPGYVEIRHFRQWLIAKYLWDGEKFIKIYDVEEEDKPRTKNKRKR